MASYTINQLSAQPEISNDSDFIIIWDTSLAKTFKVSKKDFLTFDNSGTAISSTYIADAIKELDSEIHNSIFSVSTVFGRTGNVSANYNDYNASQIYFTSSVSIPVNDVQTAIVETYQILNNNVVILSASTSGNSYNIATLSAIVSGNTNNITTLSGNVNTNIQNITTLSGSVNTLSASVSANTYNISSLSADVFNIIQSSASINVASIDFRTVGNPPSYKEGRIFYDNNSRTLGLYIDNPDVMLQIGQEMWVRAVNKTSSIITNGTVVCLSGSLGNVPKIVPSINIANSEVHHHVLGMATHNISPNEEGVITNFGLVNGLNTNSFNAGDELYLVSGSLTNILPNAPIPTIIVGYVVQADHTNGSVLVKISHIPRITELSDVNGVTPFNNAVLSYHGNVWNPTNINDILSASNLSSVNDNISALSASVSANKNNISILSANVNLMTTSGASFKTLSAGDVAAGNFTVFEPNGTIKFVGSATVWEDLRVDSTQTKQGSNYKPDYDYVNNGLLFPENDETEKIYFSVQMPHAWKVGSLVYPHIHYVQSVATSAVFVMQYKVLPIGHQVPILYTSSVTNSSVAVYTSGNIHQILNFTPINLGENSNISTFIDVIIYRMTGDGVTGDVLFKGFDIHYEIDTLGSREEFIK